MTGEAEPQLFERFQELIVDAHAETRYVVATFIDIRGFSSFAVRGGSFDTAYYLRSVYTAILTERFADRDFFKPTGDGLMLIHHLPADTDEWPEAVQSVVTRARALVADFAALTSDDYTVVPPVPELLGVGVARGNATRLVSKGIALDYAGPSLNLAARLMEKARPSGVVFSDPHAAAMLGDALLDFSEDAVYIRGIADGEPVTIYATPDVVVPQRDREPLTDLRRVWGEIEGLSVAEVRRHSDYLFSIPRRPRLDEVAQVRVSYDTFTDGRRDGSTHFDDDCELEEGRDGWKARLDLSRAQRETADAPEQSEMLKGLVRFTNKVQFQAFIRPVEE